MKRVWLEEDLNEEYCKCNNNINAIRTRVALFTVSQSACKQFERPFNISATERSVGQPKTDRIYASHTCPHQLKCKFIRNFRLYLVQRSLQMRLLVLADSGRALSHDTHRLTILLLQPYTLKLLYFKKKWGNQLVLTELEVGVGALAVAGKGSYPKFAGFEFPFRSAKNG